MSKHFDLVNEKPGEKIRYVFVGEGLNLEIHPNGARYWRVKFRYRGHERRLSLGVFPKVTLTAARKKLRQVKAQLDSGVDPSAERKRFKSAGTTFRAVANEWLTKIEQDGAADATLKKNKWFVELACKRLGSTLIDDIDAPTVLEACKVLEKRERFESAKRMRAVLSAIFVFGIATARCKSNPAADILGALAKGTRRSHPGITNPDRLGELLRLIDGYNNPIVRAYLQLMFRLAPRPGELRLSRWNEWNLDDAVWSVPAIRVKTRTALVIPLPPKAVEIVAGLREITFEKEDDFLFPSLRPGRAMSEATANAALRTLGIPREELVCHGARQTFSTFCNAASKNPDLIELCLGHVVGGSTRATYNKATMLKQRRALMVWYSRELDRLAKRQTLAAVKG